jgi:hypothetical protein
VLTLLPSQPRARRPRRALCELCRIEAKWRAVALDADETQNLLTFQVRWMNATLDEAAARLAYPGCTGGVLIACGDRENRGHGQAG